MKKRTRNNLLAGAFFAALIGYGFVFGNPVLIFMEAGPSAYYQARIAYGRSDTEGRASIAQAYQDKKISMREYSEKVWPVYVAGAVDRETVFPETEQSKSLDQLKNELSAAVQPTP